MGFFSFCLLNFWVRLKQKSRSESELQETRVQRLQNQPMEETSLQKVAENPQLRLTKSCHL